MTSQIAGRAYELYEHRAPEGGTAAQDWQKAEQELRKNRTDGQPKTQAKTDEAKLEAKPEPKPEAPDKPQPEATPQLVKRVHELYEQLGREDVKLFKIGRKRIRNLRNMKPTNNQTRATRRP